MRKFLGPLVVTAIVGGMAFVFVFYGVYSPGSTKGFGSGAVAANVNGDSIGMVDFEREYQQQLDFYQGMMKGKADPEMLRRMGLRMRVLESMIQRKLVSQEANRVGMTVPNEELRDKIEQMPYFKKDGKFDPTQYKLVLQANRRTPSSFEDAVREDLMREQMMDSLRSRALVSENEVRQQFLLSNDQRTVDYVRLDRETAKKRMAVTQKEIKDFLKTPTGLQDAKTHYEQTRFDYLKPEKKAALKKKAKLVAPKPEFYSFDEVKDKVVADLIKDRRQDQITKINRGLANQALAKAKEGEKALRAWAKSEGFKVQTSEKFNRLQSMVAGVGEVPDLINDAFQDPSPLAKGPKLYETHGDFIVAQNMKAFSPDMAAFAKDQDAVRKQLQQQKEQQIFQSWMANLRTHAKVSINDMVRKQESDDESGDN